MDLVLYKSHRGVRENKCCIIKCHSKCRDGPSDIAHSENSDGAGCVNKSQFERYQDVHSAGCVNKSQLERYQDVHRVNATQFEQCHAYDVRQGTMIHSKHKAHVNGGLMLPVVQSNIVTSERIGGRDDVVFIHHHVVSNPLLTFSVLEPLEDGSCTSDSVPLATVAQSAERRRCFVATNAGFYNAQSGTCYGNVVSNGRIAQDSGGLQNAHFGITRDGYIFVGYLSQAELYAHDFFQLIGGGLWLIRDGDAYINESMEVEIADDPENRREIEHLSNLISARNAVGHDKEGHVVMVETSGKSLQRGMNLWDFTDELLKLGLVNAVNLDGGGSTTVLINGTMVNYPPDICKEDTRFNCPRDVSTILCVHLPESDAEHLEKQSVLGYTGIDIDILQKTSNEGFVQESPHQYRWYTWSIIALSIVSTTSLVINVILLHMFFKCKQ